MLAQDRFDDQRSNARRSRLKLRRRARRDERLSCPAVHMRCPLPSARRGRDQNLHGGRGCCMENVFVEGLRRSLKHEMIPRIPVRQLTTLPRYHPSTAATTAQMTRNSEWPPSFKASRCFFGCRLPWSTARAMLGRPQEGGSSFWPDFRSGRPEALTLSIGRSALRSLRLMVGSWQLKI